MPLLNSPSYKLHGDIALTWTPIVQNVWYPDPGESVLTGDLIIHNVAVEQENTGAAAADLEVRITIDDLDPLVIAVPGAASGVYNNIGLAIAAMALQILPAAEAFEGYAPPMSFPSYHSYFWVEVRQTSVVGLVPTLGVRVVWSRKEV